MERQSILSPLLRAVAALFLPFCLTLTPSQTANAVESAVTAVTMATVADGRLIGDLAVRAAAVRSQVEAIEVGDLHRRLDLLLKLMHRHGVLRDSEAIQVTRTRLCGEMQAPAELAGCWLDALVWAQDALIDGAHLGAERQPLAVHRKRLTSKEKEAIAARDAMRQARAISQVVAALRNRGRSIEQTVTGWLHEAGPGQWPMYGAMVDGLERYRDLTQKDLPELGADFPAAKKHAWRRLSERREWRRLMQPNHRLALRRRLCFEGYCAPAAPVTAPASPKTSGRRVRAHKGPPLDAQLAARLRAWQYDRGLRPSALVDATTLAALRVPMTQRVEQIRLSLQRIRDTGVGQADAFLVANIPAFRVDVWRQGKLARSHRTQVGRGSKRVMRKGRLVRIPALRTPLMSTKLRYLVLNPEWVVPTSIRREYRRKVSKDPDFYSKNGFELRPIGRGGESLVMKSGDENLLGLVKFVFPNQHLVYLHDTPSQRAFRHPVRLKSHGCVRVEKAQELARDLLSADRGARVRDRQWARMMQGAVNKWINLRKPPAIHLVYWTADASPEGRIRFYPDPYGYDAADRRLAQQTAHTRFAGLPAAPGRMPAGPANADCPGGQIAPDGECPTR